MAPETVLSSLHYLTLQPPDWGGGCLQSRTVCARCKYPSAADCDPLWLVVHRRRSLVN